MEFRCALLRHNYSGNTRREHQPQNPPSSCQTQSLWERLISANEPSSTINMPVQIHLADPVRIQPCFAHITNKQLKLLFSLCNCVHTQSKANMMQRCHRVQNWSCDP
ncbi:hypothetical protein CHARACLAT_018110 [Characodon lateralis]|uniref:Uncharacterized protein n=1 Tax=Characodon lateralis TaxID=208331 RepID=A0ABU7EKM2_9TELE|nr:hypothetical protein [Characodon lateralis]